MNAAEPVQGAVIKTLGADGEPVDAGLAIARETPGFRSAGVGFEGNFRPGCKTSLMLQRIENPGNGFPLKQARCSAAEENRFNRAGIIPLPV